MRFTQRAVASLAVADRVVAQVLSNPATFGAVIAQVAAHEHASVGMVLHVAGHGLLASGRCGLTIRSTGPIAAGRHLGYKSLAQIPARLNRPVSSNVRRQNQEYFN